MLYSVIRCLTHFPLFLVFSLLLVSCSTDRPEGKTEAEVLYKEALKLMDEGRFILATEKLNSLRSQHPYSYFATHAELLQSDILFKQENYVESASAYILFRDFHPKHEKITYVIWRIAESFFNQLPETFDRDLSPGVEAIKYYQELIDKYPGNEYFAKAKEKIQQINKSFEEKEQYVADFYFKTKVYDAARYRYLNIMKNFSTQSLLDHSAIRILKASLKLNDMEGCKKYAEKFSKMVSEKTSSQMSEVAKTCI